MLAVEAADDRSGDPSEGRPVQHASIAGGASDTAPVDAHAAALFIASHDDDEIL